MPALVIQAQLLPLILGAALAPFWIIFVLLLLASPHGLLKAVGFVGGMTITRLIQGAIFGVLFAASPDAEPDKGGASPLVSTLLLVAGILLLITAYLTWRKADDPDAPPPKWMQAIDKISPLQALGIGAGMVGIGVKLWVFTLSALGVISGAKLVQPGSTIAYLLYLFFAQLLLITPIVAYAIAPQRSASLLKRLSDWLIQYNRPITMAVTLIFGLYFGWQGITGLLT
jgi:hypothetical protein